MTSVFVEIDLPEDWQNFRLPPALDRRLQELLDRQDRDGKLSRAEATALVEIAELISLLKLRAQSA